MRRGGATPLDRWDSGAEGEERRALYYCKWICSLRRKKKGEITHAGAVGPGCKRHVSGGWARGSLLDLDPRRCSTASKFGRVRTYPTNSTRKIRCTLIFSKKVIVASLYYCLLL
jgi:hypothetical protein